MMHPEIDMQTVDGEGYETEEDSSHKPPMSDSEILSFCENEISRGIGGVSFGGESTEITIAYDFYFGRLPGISKATSRDVEASRFVSLDVMDSIEATVAEISPMLQTPEIAFYNAENERDVPAAQRESDLVNYLFFNEFDGLILLQSALRDCLLTRNCTAKVRWDEKFEVTYEKFEDVPEMALAEIMKPTSPNQLVEITQRDVEEESSIGERVEEAAEAAQEEAEDQALLEMGQAASQGQPVDPQVAQLLQPEEETYDITVKRTTKIGRPVIEGIAAENIIVSGNHRSPVLHDARFVAHESIVTESELIQQGFDEKLIKSLPDYNANVEEISRARTPEEYDYFSSDDSVRQIRVFEVYCLLDADRDGIAERLRIIYSEGNLLSVDPVNSVGLVGGVSTIVPHMYQGVSLFERIKAIQEAKTPIWRSYIDGTRLASNPRLGILTGQVNMDDILTSKVGGIVRAESTDSVFALPTAEIPQSTLGFLGAMDALRRERGGSAVDSATQTQQIVGDSAHAFERSMSAMELANALVARTFAETFIKGIFQEMHNVIRENWTGELSKMIKGEWVTAVPSEWAKRTDVTVSIGASSAERMRLSNAMKETLMYQQQLQESGSVMFSEAKVYQAMISVLNHAGVKNPETYFVDPTSEEGQKASEAKTKQQQEMAQKEEALQQAMAKAQDDIAKAELMKGQASIMSQQAKMETDRLKDEVERMKAELAAAIKSEEITFKYEELETKNAIKLTELEIQKDKDFVDLSIQYEANKEGNKNGSDD